MSGFTFGSPAPSASAPSSGFSFGSTPAPAPSTGGFSFGGSSTPAPAPASSGFSFGGSSTPAPAPSGGGFSFGGPTPAPAAPSSSLFGGTGTQPSNPISQQPMHISANMRFSVLPPNAQKMISDTFMLLHQHKQTMNSVASMTPSSLAEEADRAAGSISSLGDTTSEIQKRQQDLGEEISSVQQRFNELSRHVLKVQQEANDLYNIAHECGIYPVQTIAARRRITLPGSYKNVDGSSGGAGTPSSVLHPASTSTPDVVQKLNTMLRDNATQVDRMEGLPSMYLWKIIEDMDTRLQNLGRALVKVEKDIKNQESVFMGNNYANEDNPVEALSLGIQNQVDMLIQIANIVGRMDQQLEGMRQAYKEKLTRERLIRSSQSSAMSPISRLNTYDMKSMIDNGKEFDPFLDADRREAQEENRIKMEVKKRNINARSSLPAMNPASGNTSAAPSSSSTPVPASGLFSSSSSGGGLFGSKPAATGLFGGSSTPTAAAPSSGFSFGGSSTPAPASSSTGGFSFGGASAPAPTTTTPSTGFSFGGSSTPAPAATTQSTGFSFGGSSTPTPAPASSGFSFGGSSTPAPAATAPSSGFSFGGSTTPAPAPSGGFSFGGAAPAPAGTDPVTPSAPPRSNIRQRRAGRRR